ALEDLLRVGLEGGNDWSAIGVPARFAAGSVEMTPPFVARVASRFRHEACFGVSARDPVACQRMTEQRAGQDWTSNRSRQEPEGERRQFAPEWQVRSVIHV